MKNLLILKAGSANEAVRARVGDYDLWFRQALASLGCRVEVIPVYLGAPLPALRGHDSVLMTGSSSSVTEEAPWALRAGEYLLEAAARRIPVLGICFGHQLLGRMLGGRVVKNPLGREIGTVEVSLTDAGVADPLFNGIPRQFALQATHEDIVVETPAEVELLASNGNTLNQALRSGPYLRGVQAHPEADAAAMKALIDAREERLRAEAASRGGDPEHRIRALHAGLRPTPFGRRVLENFIRRFP